jgi:threonylcarbamoyladenosine tRNA methylthiotransferase CDKAL1
MKVAILNLHNMCENNTHFLTRARRYFLINGHEVVNHPEEADLVFIGGCAVTDTMRRRCDDIVVNNILRFTRARFVVFGCLAAFPDDLAAVTGIDRSRLNIIGYKESHKLDELIGVRIPFEAVTAGRLHGHVPYQPRMGPADSYVMICQGCINSCSYCNIKKAKGDVVSRSEDIVEDEVRGLYAAGVRTMTLLADDCGSYGVDRTSDLPNLLARLCAVAEDIHYKIYTIFPSLFLAQAPRLEPFFAQRRVPYLCVPVQSAAPRILDLMNRRYSPRHLAETIAAFRSVDPDLFVYSHFIFNFPTETWEEFEQSIAFACHFDASVFLGYGENEGTEAASIFPKCNNETLWAKTKRLEELVKTGALSAFVVPTP